MLHVRIEVWTVETASRQSFESAYMPLGRSVSAGLWSYGGAGAKIASQFLITLVMARLLGPEPYGAMTIAMLPISLGFLVADAGLGTGLIQRREIDNGLIQQCMWWQLMIGLGAGLLVMGLSWPITLALDAPAALPLMMAVSVVFPVNAMYQVPAALLRREMRFKELQIANVSSMVLANAGVGLTLAFAGAQAWALVAAVVTQAVLNALIVWWFARPPWTLRRQAWPSSLTRFGASIIGLNISNWLITNVETMVLARLQGTIILGAYNRLHIISTGITGMLLPPLQAVILPHHSKQQEDSRLIRRQWLLSIWIIGSAFGALALPLLFMPELVITWSLGEQWLTYHRVLPPLAVAMVANAVMGLCGPVLQALGHPGREFSIQLVVAILAIPALIWAASRGDLAEFAQVVAGIACLRCLGLLGSVWRTLW